MALDAVAQSSGAGSGRVGGTLRAGCNTGLENIYKLGLIIHFLLPIIERFLFLFLYSLKLKARWFLMEMICYLLFIYLESIAR